MVSLAGIPGAGDFSFAPIRAATLPLSESGATLGAVRFDGAMHGMMEVHAQTSRCLPPLAPPLIKRSEAVAVLNPVEQIHEQIETFLQSFAQEGHATIAR